MVLEDKRRTLLNNRIYVFDTKGGIMFKDKNQLQIFKKLRIKKKSLLLTSSILIILIVGALVRYGYTNYTNNKKYSLNITSADKDFKEDKFSEAKKYYNVALRYKDDSSIKAKLILCNVVSTSLDSFNKATKLFNDKKYLDAYNALGALCHKTKKDIHYRKVKQRIV